MTEIRVHYRDQWRVTANTLDVAVNPHDLAVFEQLHEAVRYARAASEFTGTPLYYDFPSDTLNPDAG